MSKGERERERERETIQSSNKQSKRKKTKHKKIINQENVKQERKQWMKPNKIEHNAQSYELKGSSINWKQFIKKQLFKQIGKINSKKNKTKANECYNNI